MKTPSGSNRKVDAGWDEATATPPRRTDIRPLDGRDGHLRMATHLFSSGRVREAIRHCQAAIDTDDRYAEAWLLLGRAQRQTGELRLASASLRRAAELMPRSAEVLHLLGVTCAALQEFDKARWAFKAAVELNADDGTARHLLDALSGRTTTGPPIEYVAGLFDRYAATFDSHMKGRLRYRLPDRLKKVLHPVVKRHGIFRHAVDLGCGTGLSGSALRHVAHRLTGVDISRGMIAVAAEKRMYDTLVHDEITGFLRKTKDRFDLVIAADVFIYFGDLGTIFRLIRRRLSTGGLFLFTVESTSHQPFSLRRSGRYAHSGAYIRKLAAALGWAVSTDQSIAIRLEGLDWSRGRLFVLRNMGSPEGATPIR